MQTHITTVPGVVSLGSVELLVRDLSLVADFYRVGVGLEVIERSPTEVLLGSQGQGLLRLHADTKLAPARSGSAGLYHLALLFASRAHLVEALDRLLSEYGELFQGSADHLVSEAFYFQDPEGNGVELYFDRPSREWQWQQGQVHMDSLYLDPVAYSAAYRSAVRVTQEQVILGHMHLRVGDISQAEHFYGSVLGLVKTAAFNGALFMSDGWYHHHLGLNIWESWGASERSPSLGLGMFIMILKQKTDLQALLKRLQQAQWMYTTTKNGIRLFDPWRNQLRVLLVE